MGQGNEKEHSLGENLVPLVLRHEFYGSAVVQAVGKLDEHHPHIVVEGEKDSLEVLCLKAFSRDSCTFAVFVVQHGLDFGETVHQRSYLVTEQVAYVVHGVGSVLDHVVQQGRADGLASEADFRHDDFRHRNRVKYIGLSGTSAYILVGLIGKIERFLDRCELLRCAASVPGHSYELVVLFLNHFAVFRCKL